MVVSNRLPIRLEDDEHGSRWRQSPGGLVCALTPALRHRGGVWIGWTGQSGDMKIPEVYEDIALRSGAHSKLATPRFTTCTRVSISTS